MLRTSVTVFSLLVLCSPAFADNLDHPMSFKIYNAEVLDHCCDSHIEIQADGDITPTTADAFNEFLHQQALRGTDIPPESDVYFTSGGGDLIGGLKLGEIVREHHFNAVLGAHQQVSQEASDILRQMGALLFTDVPFLAPGNPGWTISVFHARFPSYCVSACTFSFLGGVRRFVPTPSVYAVHKFNFNCDAQQMQKQKICIEPVYSSSKSQELSAYLAVYLEEMGIKQSFLLDMVKAEPEKVNWIFSQEKLNKYGICTGSLGGSGC